MSFVLPLQACAGLAYSFSVYAPTIKDSLDLTQTQLATVGSAVNLGGYFAIVSGSIYDSLKDYHKLGPRWADTGAVEQQATCVVLGAQSAGGEQLRWVCVVLRSTAVVAYSRLSFLDTSSCMRA